MKKAFTLVETLVIIGMIGVITALLIPNLIKTIDNKIKERKIGVFIEKFSKSTDMLNIDNGIGPYYSTTMEFVEALSKHLKIVKICSSENLRECIPYDSFSNKKNRVINTSNLDLRNITVAINSSTKDYAETVAIVLADGTPVILAFDKNCPVGNPNESGTKASMGCIAGLYDINGSSKPNIIGEDIIGINNVCTIDLGSFCLSTPFNAKPMTLSECQTELDGGSLGIKYCGYANDYWAGAVRACGGVSNLPTLAQLQTLSSKLYSNKTFLSTSTTAQLLGLEPTFKLWTSQEISWGGSYRLSFDARGSSLGDGYYYDGGAYGGFQRQDSGVKTVCLSN